MAERFVSVPDRPFSRERVLHLLREFAEKKSAEGYTAWVSLAWYPALYLMYSAGIAALASKNYEALAAITLTPVAVAEGRRGAEEAPAAKVISDGVSDSRDAFKLLPAHERQYAGRSEYLFETLGKPLDDLVLRGRQHERFFDRFEVILALCYASVDSNGWVPAGRFAWKHQYNHENSPLARVLQEAAREGDRWPLLRAEMFGGSTENFSQSAKITEGFVAKLGWH